MRYRCASIQKANYQSMVRIHATCNSPLLAQPEAMGWSNYNGKRVPLLMSVSPILVLFFLLFPLCRGEACLLVTPKYGYFCNLFPFVPVIGISLYFSSATAILRSLFAQSSHLSSGLPRFLEPSCFFVADIFGNLLSFILTMCPAHFIRLLTILPPIQTLVPTSFLAGLSFSVSELPLLRLFSLSSCSHILVFYVDRVRTELTSPSHMI